MYSSPVLLKGADGSKYVKVTLDENGQPQFNVVIPAGYTGKHTIVLLNDKGDQLAWADVWVVPSDATAFDETVAEINLKYSENHFGTGSGNGLGTGSGNGFGTGSGFGTFTGTTYVGTDGDASDGSADANGAAANGAAANGADANSSDGGKSAAAQSANNSAMGKTGVDLIPVCMLVVALFAASAVAAISRRVKIHASSEK